MSCPYTSFCGVQTKKGPMLLCSACWNFLSVETRHRLMITFEAYEGGAPRAAYDAACEAVRTELKEVVN